MKKLNKKHLRRCPGKSYWIEIEVCEARQRRGWCRNKKCRWKTVNDKNNTKKIKNQAK